MSAIGTMSLGWQCEDAAIGTMSLGWQCTGEYIVPVEERNVGNHIRFFDLARREDEEIIELIPVFMEFLDG